MAEQDYQKKLESLQKYIPFLVNMMVELKAKGNREAQLAKIQSLHDMITNTKKKLKLETLNRCEEVLTNIYFKVNPQLRSTKLSGTASPSTLPGIESPRSTPQSPSPTRDIIPTTPVTIPTEKIDIHSKGFDKRSSLKSDRPRVDVYSNVVINNPSKVKAPLIPGKYPDMSKPPISLDDLKTLEDDVQKKITDAAFVNKSVDELQEVKKQIQLQLRVDEITASMNDEKPADELANKTAGNVFTISKKSSSNERKARVNESIRVSKHSTSDRNTSKGKRDDKLSQGSKVSKKSLKDIDIFGNVLSSIDDKLLEEKKKSKKGDRRSSLTQVKEDNAIGSSISSDKGNDKEISVKKGKDSKDKMSESSILKNSVGKYDKTEKKRDRIKSDIKNTSSSGDKKASDHGAEAGNKNARHNADDIKDETLKNTINVCQNPEANLNPADEIKIQTNLDNTSKNFSETKEINNAAQQVSPQKRLADKYNPKPKPKAHIVDVPDVEKTVSESIEKLMKVSPVKTLPRPSDQSSHGVRENEMNTGYSIEQNKPVQLPDILQRIFSKPLLGDIIPKRLNEQITTPSHVTHNRLQNSELGLDKPRIIQPSETLIRSPLQSMQYQQPHFVSPPRPPEMLLSPDTMSRPPLLSASSSGHGLLPTPPIPPSLPVGFMDHSIDMNFATPRMDFESPGTPMPEFSSPRMEFERPTFPRNENFNFNQRFMPHTAEYQMHGFDPRNTNFMGQGHFAHQPEVNAFNTLNQGPAAFYNRPNHMPVHVPPEAPQYVHNPSFYQERSHWTKDRRPGDPRSYREYKEMKERQERETKAFQEKQQKEIKDPRLAPRESRDGYGDRDSRFAKDTSIESVVKDKVNIAFRDPRLSRGRAKSAESFNDSSDCKGREEDKSCDREFSGNRSQGRDNFKNLSSFRDPRCREGKPEINKFDKMYSIKTRARSPLSSRNREDKHEDDESFLSPLDSLYNAGEKGKTGRGYGVQNFRIPRKAKEVDEKRVLDMMEENSNIIVDRRRINEISDSEDSDSNNIDNDLICGNDSPLEDTKEEKDAVDNNVTIVKEGNSDVDISRIKVVMKSQERTNNIWDWSNTDEFISEYDREFKNNENVAPLSVNENIAIQNVNEISGNDLLSGSKTDSNAIKNMETVDVQFEEPSSSQDVLEKSSNKNNCRDDFKNLTDPTEADNSKKGEDLEISREVNAKNDEPLEQNILAHFFENLLKSSNKKDKKTALFSLIETFSDSFDDKEIQKIRKIIKVDEDAEGESDDEKEDSSNSLQNKVPVGELRNNDLDEEQPIVGSTTEEQGPSGNHKAVTVTVEKSSLTNETQVNEVTKSTDESDLQSNEDLKSDDSILQSKDIKSNSFLEPVLVSVGERIKNRKRNQSAKPKKKCKSELDLLHEDIQDMFIRDGVLTATGKRMCRILKDDPNALISRDQTDSTLANDQPKKVRKKPGPKPKIKVINQDICPTSLKDMRVVIKKMPDDVLLTSRQLRNRSKQNYVEIEDDTLVEDASFSGSFEVASDKSDFEGESSNESEDDKNSTTEDMPKPRTKRRKVAKWASGIIPKVKNKKKKLHRNKSKENSPDRVSSPASLTPSDSASFSEFHMDKLIEPDKEYYYDYTNKRKLTCKLCKYSGHLLTGHYLREHPQSEILCSRFSPDVAAGAIKDFSENGELFESIVISKISTKYHYSCRMCGYNSFVSPIFFYEHVTTHTGEYRHHCGFCEFVAVTSKTMAVHFTAVHPGEEKKVIKKTYPMAVIFAYMCGECNFVQLEEKSVHDHANIFHLGEKPTVYKINMSTILDPQLIKSSKLKAIESKLTDEKPVQDVTESDSLLETPTHRKPGPKSKVELKQITIEPEKGFKSVAKKRPGPKSKTCIPESEDMKATDFSSPMPVRKKPGPKSKTQCFKPSVTEETSVDADIIKQPNQPEVAEPASVSVLSKDIPTRKRRRSLDKLISEDSADDLDTIITLSSRSSRAAKEKATAKLKTLMENNEGSPTKRRNDSELVSKDQEDIIGKINEKTEIAKNDRQTGNETFENEEEKNRKTETTEKIIHLANKNSNLDGKDLNVFTCKNDILQEDAKKIEEDRLRKMDELNKSIVSRTLKLDFITKLCDKLNKDQESDETVTIKTEPIDKIVSDLPSDSHITSQFETLSLPATKTLPTPNICKSPAISKKPVFEEETVVQQPNVKFRQDKSNSLFSNMIEKLQDKLNEAAVEEEEAPSSMDLLPEEAIIDDNQTSAGSEAFIIIGDLVRATKINKEILYSCHANNCYVATKDKVVFQLHCKFGHKDLNIQSSLCERCGVVVETTPVTTLLENLYDHLVFAHSEFLGKSSLRMRRLSGDKLSVKKEKEVSMQSATNVQEFEAGTEQDVLQRVPQENQSVISQSIDPVIGEIESSPSTANEEKTALEPAEDNPFSFKIASVMSLADAKDNQSTQSSATKQISKTNPKLPALPPLKFVPPLTLIQTAPKQQTTTPQALVIKEAKLTTSELSRPKKAPKALQKFKDCPGDLYKCPHFYCMFSTNARALLTCHLKAHKCDSATMVPCVYCDMKTPWEHVPMHIDIRHASSKYSCSHCLYRAALKEYVVLHQEQSHPNLDYVVYVLPAHKAAKKFSVADSKTDYKGLCEPFRCFCKDKGDTESQLREYLFETEFIQHLNKAHPNENISCGYSKCNYKVNASMMLNHWAMFHGVCTYQCGYCKTSSKEISKMYTHFSQMHPNMNPDILVRKNDFLPQDRELWFSEDAFEKLGHIRKVPSTLLTTIGKRAQRTVKLIPLNTPTGAPEECNASPVVRENSTTGISQGALLIQPLSTLHNVPSTSVSPQLLLSNSNLKFIVASTSGNNEKLYLLPTSMVSPRKGQSVTSIAPISKVTVQTSTASKSNLRSPEALPLEPIKIGSTTVLESDMAGIVLPTSINAQGLHVDTTLSSSLQLHTGAVMSQSLLTTTVSVSSTAPRNLLCSPAELHDAEKVLSAKVSTVTAKIKSISRKSDVSLINNELVGDTVSNAFLQDDLTLENDNTAISEDDMLQSAIQSILEQDDDSTNSSATNSKENNIQKSSTIRTSSPAPLLSEIVLDPPPLVLITDSKTDKTSLMSSISTPSNNPVFDSIAPVEHIEINGNLDGALEPEEDPLNLESNNDSNFTDNDIVDPLLEGLLTVTPNLSAGDPLSIDESLVAGEPLATSISQSENSVVPPIEAETFDGERDPLKISNMRRSISMVSTSDDESDSSPEKKKRGLMGYQLFRCAVCNLSFSNVKPFKSHIGNASQCRISGSKAFQCVHCEKVLKTPQRLADHIMTHGIQRFTCSLCNEKFTTVGITKLHMKNRHSIHQTNLIPLKGNRNDMEIDDFIVKPCQPNPPNVKDKESVVDNPKLAMEESTYTPDQIETIPIRQIFNTNVKCGLCNYQTKVRVNIIRHLQMHLEEKAVPDIAPVNPVPCLEKNEKMFDKMINLAASSFNTSGRMGGGAKDKEKEEHNHPEFVPSHRRFVCCAQGCSYLCPEEANLKHHLVALHSDEANFTCAHCKVKIEPIDIENVMKHFKLHGLHLYKCQYCSFIHHLKHKIDRHIIDGHPDMVVKVVTIRSMETEPQEFAPQDEAAAATPQISLTPKFKPWNCCMCKAKYHTKEDIQSHIMKKHNIDAQYKCTLCAFKDDQEDRCREHFKEKHPNHEFDIIFVYQKIEEDVPKDDPVNSFDTTPLWQRDKPRVRHIRGILFDESSPQPTKSPKKSKTYGPNTTKVSSAFATKILASGSSKETPNTSTSTTSNADTRSKNVFDCIDAVARGIAGVLQSKPGSSGLTNIKKDVINKVDETVLSKNKSFESSSHSTEKNTNPDVADDTTNDDVVVIHPKSPNIIVIDSDESDAEVSPKSDLKGDLKMKNSALKRQSTTDLLKEAVKMAKIEEVEDEDYLMASSCSRQNLIEMFGEFGSPHNKQWKCPKCNQFKSKRVGDFMFHLYKDFNLYRYRCKLCKDHSITYKYMVDHTRCHPGYDEDIIETLPPNIKLDTWIHMVLREQSLVILKNAPLFKKRPISGHTDIMCYFCNEKFMSMPECCEHMLYHWVMMPYQCQHCPHEFYTVYDLKHHQKIEHPDARLYDAPRGPTLSKVIQCIENIKKRPPKSLQETTVKKKLRTEENLNARKETLEEITCGVVINTYKGKKTQSNCSPKPVAADIINLEDDDDDLVIVSKTDEVPTDDNIFACDVCAYIADSETLVMKHLFEKHQIKIKKYHILSKTSSESDNSQKLACNICDVIFSELKLRRHFLENHLESHTYAPYRFYCGVCFARFLTSSRVRTHFIRVHPDKKMKYHSVLKKINIRKKYVCPLCTYTTTSPNTISIRSHLRGHLKPVLCNHCNMRFRYQSEVLAHSAKEHIGLEPNSMILNDVEKEFAETVKASVEHAEVVPDEDVINISNVSLIATNDPLKNIAKKSTSAPFLSPKYYPEEKEELNYYGKSQDELDLSKIRTTFELDKLEYTTTAEQMMKMINMDTYVDVSDCVVQVLSLNPS